SLYFELHDLDARCADIAQGPRDAGLLPIEFSTTEHPSSVGVSRHALGKLPSVYNNPDSGRCLCDRRCRLAWLKHQAPAADAVVAHDLHIAESVCTRRGLELSPLAVTKHEINQVERRLANIGDFVSERRILAMSRVSRTAAWRRFKAGYLGRPEILIRQVGGN